MILKTIELTGYSSYKDYTCIPLDLGITGIFGSFSGLPDQSNGSGKTSLLMAIIYALYGEGEFDKVEELKNDNSENMCVKITFELNNMIYTLERGIEKNRSYLIFLQDGIRLGDSIATTQDELTKLIGMDYAMFTASVFFEQGNMDKFINAPAETRRKYVDKVIGNEVWTELSKTNSKELKDLNTKIEATKDIIKSISDSIMSNNKIIFTQDAVLSSIFTTRGIIKELTAEVATYANIDTAQQKLEELTTKKTQCETYIQDIKNQLDDIILLQITSKDYATELANVAAILLDLNSAQDKLLTEIAEIEIERTSYATDLAVNTTQIALLDEKIRQCTEELADITEGICSKCKQAVDLVSLQRQNDNKLTEIAQLNTELLDATLRRKTIKIQCDDSTHKYAAAVTKKDDIALQINQNNTINTTLLAERLADIKNKETSQQQQTIIQAGLTQKVQELVDITAEITPLTLLLIDAEDSQQKLLNARSKLSDATFNLEALQKDIGKIELIAVQTEELSKQLADYTDTLTLHMTEKTYLEVTVKAFQEIPRQIFEKSIKDVADLSNSYIQEIYPHVQVKFYEDQEKKNKPLVISCLVDNNYRSYKRLSGGQRTVVNIGLRLGFSKILMKRAKTQLQFLVLDEPFGALDVKNRSLIKKVLTLLSDQFKQIFIVTHTEDESDFQNVIKVKMDSNYCSSI